MRQKQFRVLYRQFLFRIVDLELLTSYGDTNMLLGRLAALLAFLSLVYAMGAVLFDPGRMTPDALLAARWTMEHRLISVTMLATGLFSVLSWDAIYPDRRDVLVLAPLPVRSGTVFFAKLAASAVVLGAAILALNLFTGMSWPWVLVPETAGWFGGVRSLLAYWLTMAAASTFIFATVLSLQGLMAQLLPYRRFVRISSLFQLVAFCLFVSVFLLQPSLATPAALLNAEARGILIWLPSYWFLGLFQEFNGSAHPAMSALAFRAVAGLAIAIGTAAAAFMLSYFRTTRKILEEPDIAPSYRLIQWSPRVGNSLRTAVLLFSVRTLLRSRQHRVLLAFYLGVAFALVVAYLKTPLAQRELTPGAAGLHVNVPAMVSSIVVLVAAIVGTRVVFALPLFLAANWVFRVTSIHSPNTYVDAVRWSLLGIAAFPVCAASSVLFFHVWPWRPVLAHISVLLLLSLLLTELCLHAFHKLPFTCSYLPGKSNIQIAFGISFMGLIALTHGVTRIERHAIEDPGRYLAMTAVLISMIVAARWRTSSRARSAESVMQYDDAPPPVICSLDLHKDGVALR